MSELKLCEYCVVLKARASAAEAELARVTEEREAGLKLTDDELSALIEACNVAGNHNSHPRPPWDRAGYAARTKLIVEERRRGQASSAKQEVAPHHPLDAISMLARVTAERDETKGIVGYPGSESLRAAGLSDSLPDVVRWTHREWLRQTHAATQRVLTEQSRADKAEAKLKAAREALEREINAKSPNVTNADGLCPVCKRWGTDRRDGDDHDDDCAVLAATKRWEDWRGRIREVLAAIPSPPPR